MSALRAAPDVAFRAVAVFSSNVRNEPEANRGRSARGWPKPRGAPGSGRFPEIIPTLAGENDVPNRLAPEPLRTEGTSVCIGQRRLPPLIARSSSCSTPYRPRRRPGIWPVKG